MIDWSAIDTVLLDMDGTLLDLHFDNHFWMQHLPARYAEQHGHDPEHATHDLHQRFERKQNTIQWYCTDYWSAELAVDIPELKREVAHLIAERPKARHLLEALGKAGRQRILITNAHRDSLNIKLAITGIDALLDRLISSHDYGVAKEHPTFWSALQNAMPFDPSRTLFIDDSETVLAAAANYGVAHLLCIKQPDSKGQVREDLRFPAIGHFDEILPIP